MFDALDATSVYKNPFGDEIDGNYDARWFRAIGRSLGVDR